MDQNKLQVIAQRITEVSKSSPIEVQGARFSVQVVGSTSVDAGAATVSVEVSNVPADLATEDGDWVEAGEIELVLGATKTSGSLTIVVPWERMRINVSAISGTDAEVSAYGCGG